MQKIEIGWSENKTTSTGKEYKKVSYKTETGEQGEASVWSDAPFYAEVAPGATIVAEIKVNGQYKNLVGAVERKTGSQSGLMAKKEQSIAQAQDRKNRAIVEAQDRSAWMWAKNNASMLVANHPSYKFLPANGIESTIEELATKIYNFEPLAPFN